MLNVPATPHNIITLQKQGSVDLENLNSHELLVSNVDVLPLLPLFLQIFPKQLVYEATTLDWIELVAEH